MAQVYRWVNGSTLSAGNSIIYNWSTLKEAQSILPFNACRIVNNSTQDILFYLNQKNAFYIPSGNILSMDKDAVQNFRSFKIENKGSDTINVNTLIVEGIKQ